MELCAIVGPAFVFESVMFGSLSREMTEPVSLVTPNVSQEELDMSPVDDLFLREDLSRPENRVNVALFGLMQQDWFRGWFLAQLDLPTAAVVYPPTNWNGARPDLKVVGSDGSTLARIEVELSSNAGQVQDYENRYTEPIKTVWGRESNGGDLALDEIAAYLDSQTGLSPQTTLNAQFLRDLIREGLEGASSSSGRAPVAEEMHNHELVAGLKERLGGRLLFDCSGAPAIGYLKADTNKPQGFSLGVNSGESSNRVLKIMSITAGTPKVYFPSLAKLNKYLPGHHAEVQVYASVLQELGIDIGRYEENERPWRPLDDVLGRIDALAYCALALANHPLRGRSMPEKGERRDTETPAHAQE